MLVPGIELFLFAYNEVASLEDTTSELLDHLRRTGAEHTLTIVDDGSTDGTSTLADEIAANTRNVRVIHHPKNLGLGGVWRTCFDNVQHEYVTFFPADGQFPGDIVGQFYEKIADHDMVLGYLTRNRGALSTMLSISERILYRALVGKVPKFQAMLMLRSKVLEELTLHSTGRGWGIAMELVLRTARSGYRVISIPIGYRPRRHGVSRVNNLRSIRENVRQLLALRRVLKTPSKA